MNGEDYYAVPGQRLYVAANEGRFEEIVLGINLDDVGYHRGRNAYSLYGCPDALGAAVRDTFAQHNCLIKGEPWYQGDHMLFVLNSTPALAVTSELMLELMATITHTGDDTPETVDVGKLAALAFAVRDLITRLGENNG
jgi:aminopeptidase YwaD